MTFMRKTVVTVVLCLLCSLASAQIVTYNNETQLFGAAATFAQLTPLVLEKTLAFCEKFSPSVKEKSNLAIENWKGRHALYLFASARFGDALAQRSVDSSIPKEERQALKKLIETDLPRLVASKAQSYIEPLRIAKENGTADNMCGAFINEVENGKFDLKTYDPQLADYLDKVLR